MNILVLNPGSSTLKFRFYGLTGSSDEPDANILASGCVDSVGSENSNFKFEGDQIVQNTTSVLAKTMAQATEHIVRRLRSESFKSERSTETIEAVGFRVVHGGGLYSEPTLVTTTVLDEVTAFENLAPLHIPAEVAAIRQIQLLVPKTPIVAVFDSAFHQTLPPVAYTYALPVEVSDLHRLRRYGFHGISHSYVSSRLISHLGRPSSGTKVITCHLGNGASICAVRDGQSIDISMGFTPLEGLVMGTRSGDIDAGLVLYLIRAVGMTPHEVDELLNEKSGMFGISDLSADVRILEQAAIDGNKRAELSLDVFAYRAAKYIAAFAAALDGLDSIAFTGGIGEHSISMRHRICSRLGFFGLRIEAELNNSAVGGADAIISAEDSLIQTWVIPTNEEEHIASSTYRLLS